MAAILQTLSGNPLSTPIGQKIELATDASLQSEDWSLNMEICDMINDTDEGPKDAARAIKRRLQQNAGKNHVVVMYTLTLLETCVKNCGKRFHLLVTSKDFAQDLVKLIGPRNDPPLALQEKVLNLIQSWFDAFKSHPDYSGIVQVYSELKSKGIEFPTNNIDSTAPIYMPQRSASLGGRSYSNTDQGLTSSSVIPSYTRSPTVSQANFNPNVATPISLSRDQLAKLRHELDIVNSNMKVFAEMLNEMTPGKEHADDWKLLKDLNSTCQAMQKRIVDLVEKVTNEEITNELLRLNDELNYLFERYERYERKKVQSMTSKPSSNQEPSLLDLTSDITNSIPSDILPNRMQGLSIATTPKSSVATVKDFLGGGDADFDMFAQSRSSATSATGDTAGASPSPIATAVSPASGAKSKTETSSSGLGNDNVDIGLDSSNVQKPMSGDTKISSNQIDSERDLNEMEKWLLDQEACEPSVTSSQFDQFLSRREDAAHQAKDEEKKPKPDPFGI